MQLLRLTALSLLFFALATVIVSCEKDAERNKTIVYAKSDIPMTGAQAVPTSPSTALGSLNVLYNKSNKTLNYTFTWSGLSAAPTNVSIFGPAPTGYAAAATKQTIITSANSAFPASGSYTGSVVVDNVVIKEQELLNHLYYISMRTPSYPGGEIRGQIRFQ